MERTITKVDDKMRQHIKGRCICRVCKKSFGDDFLELITHWKEYHPDRHHGSKVWSGSDVLRKWVIW